MIDTPKQRQMVIITPAQCQEPYGQFEQQSTVSSSSRSGTSGASLDALTETKSVRLFSVIYVKGLNNIKNTIMSRKEVQKIKN